ncbi:MAG TPA: Rieske 2Fe-2S domain-containing protein [Caldimonas sp.]|nr:Rieske 2Fe-2S domain-containing protein [Caldimonas sp.]
MPERRLGALAPVAAVPAPRQKVCDSAALLERGRAHVFDVLRFGEPARAFALRFDGVVVAYLNRCVHVPTELDWQPGEFLDASREFIICSIHGAAYAPHGGRCIGGPCASGKLVALEVGEEAGVVWWQPTRDTRAAPAAPSQGSPSQ